MSARGSTAPPAERRRPEGGRRYRRPAEPPRDEFLDLVRSVALVRVVAWHTWSWAWLSWIPAMPAMFFTTGALLDRSVARRGWSATVRQRARRLLLPYWAYAAVCWVVMAADGWRPGGAEALRWVVPLLDPVGSDGYAGLWVPLWYLRAYLWFVLVAGLLRALRRAVGAATVPAAGAAAVALWWWTGQGHEVPLAVGDAVTYLPFVLAGMGYGATGRRPGRAGLAVLAVVAAVASVVAWQRYGPVDAVVNRSYLLTLLVGTAGLAAVLALRARAVGVAAALRRPVAAVNRRALTIYLWHGFGLVVADRLVRPRVTHGVLEPVATMAAMVVVVVGAAVVAGPIEDLAAGRRVGRPRPQVLVGVPALALVVAAAVVPVPAGTTFEAPLSGVAVVERAALTEDLLGAPGRDVPHRDLRGTPLQVVLEAWVDENTDLVARTGMSRIAVAASTADGRPASASWVGPDVGSPAGDAGSIAEAGEPLRWLSMSKALTAAWLASLSADGVVALDDPVGPWLPELPGGEAITFGHLARHTSGLPSELDAPLEEADPAADLARVLAGYDPVGSPGERYAYSRNGYYLLALALERASGTTWTEAIGAFGRRAGVEVRTDGDLEPLGHVTDPDGHGYRGRLWSSGGVVTDLDDAATLLGWLVNGDGLDDAAVEAMWSFSSDPAERYSGVGLVPLCPCTPDGDALVAERAGLDAVTGRFALDATSGAAVVVRPDAWWRDRDGLERFLDLEHRLLSALAT